MYPGAFKINTTTVFSGSRQQTEEIFISVYPKQETLTIAITQTNDNIFPSTFCVKNWFTQSLQFSIDHQINTDFLYEVQTGTFRFVLEIYHDIRKPCVVFCQLLSPTSMLCIHNFSLFLPSAVPSRGQSLTFFNLICPIEFHLLLFTTERDKTE